MASSRSININITLKEKGAGSSTPDVPKPDTPVVVDDTQKKNCIQSWQTLVFSQAFNDVKEQIKDVGLYSLNRYFDLTEDYMSENTLRNATTAIKKTISFGSAIYTGFKLGSTGGAVGSFVGITVATATWLVNDSIGKMKKWQTARLNQSNANYETGFAQVRAGLIDGSRGTMN